MLVTGWLASRDVLSSRGSQSCCWGSRTHKHIFGPQTTLYTWPLPSQASGLLFFLFLFSFAVKAFAYLVSGCFTGHAKSVL